MQYTYHKFLFNILEKFSALLTLFLLLGDLLANALAAICYKPRNQYLKSNDTDERQRSSDDANNTPTAQCYSHGMLFIAALNPFKFVAHAIKSVMYFTAMIVKTIITIIGIVLGGYVSCSCADLKHSLKNRLGILNVLLVESIKNLLTLVTMVLSLPVLAVSTIVTMQNNISTNSPVNGIGIILLSESDIQMKIDPARNGKDGEDGPNGGKGGEGGKGGRSFYEYSIISADSMTELEKKPKDHPNDPEDVIDPSKESSEHIKHILVKGHKHKYDAHATPKLAALKTTKDTGDIKNEIKHKKTVAFNSYAEVIELSPNGSLLDAKKESLVDTITEPAKAPTTTPKL